MREPGQVPLPRISTAVRVWLHGVFPAGTADDAQRAVAGVVTRSPVPVRGVQVRLSAHRDPAVHFPVVAQANVDLHTADPDTADPDTGEMVRVQVNAATAREAITLLGARLRYQLDRAGPVATGPLHLPLPHPWVASFPRPPQDRRIARTKPWRLMLLGVDEAVRVMELRDYAFHLFVETGSGQDSVVYHAGPAGYRLAQLVPEPGLVAPYTAALTWFDRPAPTLRPEQAADRMGLCEVAFLFFHDAGRRRGSVLYRRNDGHYGLIRPPGRVRGEQER